MCKWNKAYFGSQRQRWVATSLLTIDIRLRKVKGFKHLKELRDSMKNDVNKIERTVDNLKLIT